MKEVFLKIQRIDMQMRMRELTQLSTALWFTHRGKILPYKDIMILDDV